MSTQRVDLMPPGRRGFTTTPAHRMALAQCGSSLQSFARNATDASILTASTSRGIAVSGAYSSQGELASGLNVRPRCEAWVSVTHVWSEPLSQEGHEG